MLQMWQFYRPTGHRSDRTIWAMYPYVEGHFFMHGSEIADGTPLTITTHFLPFTAYVTLLSCAQKSRHSNSCTCAQWWYKYYLKSIENIWLKACKVNVHRLCCTTTVVHSWVFSRHRYSHFKNSMQFCIHLVIKQWSLNSLKYIYITISRLQWEDLLHSDILNWSFHISLAKHATGNLQSDET